MDKQEIELLVALYQALAEDVRNQTMIKVSKVCTCATCTALLAEFEAKTASYEAKVVQALLNVREYIANNDPRCQLINAVGDIKRDLQAVASSR